MRKGTFGCIAAAILAAAAVPSIAPACSLCDSTTRNQNTYRQNFDNAKVVLYGTLANPKLQPKRPGAPPDGAGTTDLHVLRVLKDDPALAGRAVVELSKYIPILDPKSPPKWIVYCSIKDGQPNPYGGREVQSEALLAYLQELKGLQGKDRTQQLLHYCRYLGSADSQIAQDAFLEFALCSDAEIGSIAKHLPVEQLRKLLQDPKTPTERLGLYAFLLGGGGNDKGAAALLRKMIDDVDGRTVNALDGLLSGYIALEPREGWDLTAAILTNAKKPYNQRFAAVRTLRFFHAWKPADTHKEVLRCLAAMLPDGEVADMAVDDLRVWKIWDSTKEVLAHFGKASHDSPLARRNIVRYALCCPQPEAAAFVANLRRNDPELVREVEESLENEKG